VVDVLNFRSVFLPISCYLDNVRLGTTVFRSTKASSSSDKVFGQIKSGITEVHLIQKQFLFTTNSVTQFI